MTQAEALWQTAAVAARSAFAVDIAGWAWFSLNPQVTPGAL